MSSEAFAFAALRAIEDGVWDRHLGQLRLAIRAREARVREGEEAHARRGRADVERS